MDLLNTHHIYSGDIDKLFCYLAFFSLLDTFKQKLIIRSLTPGSLLFNGLPLILRIKTHAQLYNLNLLHISPPGPLYSFSCEGLLVQIGDGMDGVGIKIRWV